ncbi:apolipoprotein N-acyltransferase [bacterium BMS3Abin04]|nr:apolipoprotein N-acyltransferase [bacterium BMS3Abin04]
MIFFKNIFKRYSTKEERKKHRRNLLFGLLSGILLGISFPPVPLPYFVFIALIPYLYVLEKLDGLAEINRFTYFTAFIFNIITLYWVGSWTPDADPFLMISGTVLMFFNPILFLIPSTLYYFSKKLLSRQISLFLLPIFWVSYEFAYSITEFRFPWLTLGNSLPYFNQYIQIADIVGVYGLSLLILYANVTIYKVIFDYIKYKKFNIRYILIALLILFVPLIYGVIKINNYVHSNKKIEVGLIQPNLNPNKKWDAGNLDAQLDLYLSLSDSAIKKGAELLIWPETALPVYLLSGRYSKEVTQIRKYLDSNNVSLITGMPNVEFFPNPENAPPHAKPVKNSKTLYTSYNSILGFNPNEAKIQKYGKIKLVPFGEKIPYVEYFPWLNKWLKWNVGISSWNTGRDTVVMKIKEGSIQYNVGAVVCIESIYPDFVSQFVKKGANFIAIVTNDSWYGNSSGPYQHKEISVLRAVENRRTVVRAANGGISCIIDPLGNTIKHTEMFTRTSLVGEVELRSGLTFYTRYPLFIPYTVCFISVLTIILFVGIEIKRKIK